MCVCYNNKSKYQMKNLICNWQVILFHILFYCYLHHLVNSLPHIHVCFCRVMTLHMSPMDDTFVSGSLDRTLRLWDLRSPNCQVLKMTMTFLQKKSQKWLLIITWKQENYILFSYVFSLRGWCMWMGDLWQLLIQRVWFLQLEWTLKWLNCMIWGLLTRYFLPIYCNETYPSILAQCSHITFL